MHGRNKYDKNLKRKMVSSDTFQFEGLSIII